MLQIAYIRENRTQVLERLAVKNFKHPELVDEIIKLDEDRRQTQSKLDTVSAEANTAAKQIGDLMRQGKKEEVEAIKTNTASLKEQIKTLADQLNELEEQLQQQLVLLPNVPHASVPKGTGADDNEIAFEVFSENIKKYVLKCYSISCHVENMKSVNVELEQI